MIIEDRNDAMLIKFLDIDNNDRMICCYHTTAINETLKLFITAKENNITLNTNPYSECLDEKYKGREFSVYDIEVTMGSEIDLPIIRVYVKWK